MLQLHAHCKKNIQPLTKNLLTTMQIQSNMLCMIPVLRDYRWISFVVLDAFGGYGKEGLRAIKEIIRRGASRLNILPSIYKPQCWQRLSMSLQRSNTRMILSKINHP